MHQSAPRRRSVGGRRRSGDLINWGNNNNHRDTRWHSSSSFPESEPSCGREDCCEQPRLMGNNNWPGDIPSQHCPPSIWLLTPLTATHKHGGRITLLHFIMSLGSFHLYRIRIRKYKCHGTNIADSCGYNDKWQVVTFAHSTSRQFVKTSEPRSGVPQMPGQGEWIKQNLCEQKVAVHSRLLHVRVGVATVCDNLTTKRWGGDHVVTQWRLWWRCDTEEAMAPNPSVSTRWQLGKLGGHSVSEAANQARSVCVKLIQIVLQ